jgi:hypothetical protein
VSAAPDVLAGKDLRLEIDPARRGIAHIVGADDLAGFLLGMRCGRVVACVNAMTGIADPESLKVAVKELIESMESALAYLPDSVGDFDYDKAVSAISRCKGEAQ